ncbi:hypothetical protein Cni_G11363 [Canna indica]|uniref:Uncharacterized protein n=1 Tax=Canna indica TaxID=4628 RepID=A0AAQ3K7N7_9LILI|nr:hypothetical protein Cni_G11363 [Canna indica]
MRILSWVQNKFNGRPDKRRLDAGSFSASCASVADVRKDEFNDWADALLAIGTFGNKDLKEEPKRHDPSENLYTDEEDLPDFTMEEVNTLQKELAKLLTRKPKCRTSLSEIAEEDRANQPLNRFLNCPSSLEVDRKLEHLGKENHGDLSPNTKIILNKVKDALLGNSNALKKNSLSFLFKKIFVCGSGFAPPRSLRDAIPEPRIEKILRAIIAKKIYPQSFASTVTKKYLENRTSEKMHLGNEEDKRKDQYRWVKTDSEYIVLEI